MIKFILESYVDNTFTVVPGFDDAVIGIDENNMKLVYSVKKCLDILQKGGMSFLESIEYFEYNVRRKLYENEPIWCQDIWEE